MERLKPALTALCLLLAGGCGGEEHPVHGGTVSGGLKGQPEIPTSHDLVRVDPARLAGIAVAGEGTAGPIRQDDPPGTLIPGAALGATAGPGVVSVPNMGTVSQCGGFKSRKKSSPAGTLITGIKYCDAELLWWYYDKVTGDLSLKNTRVLLNCCGEHGITAMHHKGVLEITETDAPMGGNMRCGCTCVFDFGMVAAKVPPGITKVKLVRHVTEVGPKTVYSGPINLLQGAGIIVTDNKSAGLGCSP